MVQNRGKWSLQKTGRTEKETERDGDRERLCRVRVKGLGRNKVQRGVK